VSSQSGNEKRQLTGLKNNQLFNDVFTKIILNNKDIDEKEKEFILSCAIIFFNQYNSDKRYKSYFKIGYYIILKYSLLFDDYKPLYDISLQIGFYPISNFILNKKYIEIDSVEELIINKSISKNYMSFENYIETVEQNISSKGILKNLGKNIAYIAPTSYGKSSLVKEIITKNNYSKIGIIVPTKSLLIQTYKDIKSLNLDYKLILHDEMYNNGNERIIAILTQERATRLISKTKTSFDVLFIDEAHNLLKKDSRSIILSRLIQLNGKKNVKQKLIYLTPLIQDEKNIKVDKIPDNELYASKINYDLKISDLYLFEKNKGYAYDKFTGQYFIIKEQIDYFEYIKSFSLNKNFIYQTRPKLIEKLANTISNTISKIEITEEINKVINTLKAEVHESFYLIPLIEKGIVYIHGKIPNIVKEYIEDKFKSISSLKYIIANQVILEGINLPIDSLFITSAYRLEGKDLVNLIGRVNRLNYVFQNDNLNLLISKIHFLNHEEYGSSDIKNKMELLRNHSFDDKLENPLLKEYNIDSLKLNQEVKAKRELVNQLIIQESEILLAQNELDFRGVLKKYIIENNINDYYKDLESLLNVLVENISHYKFDEKYQITDIISKIFIQNNELNIRDYEIERLKNPQAIKYYNYYLDITQKQSLNERINFTVAYLKTKSKSNDPQLYIGKSYGEERRYSNQYTNEEYINPVYVNLSRKTDVQLVNLAIVKLKIEEDFVGFKLNKLIVFLYDFKLITEDYYFNYVYGTTDLNIINLVRFGLNVNIVKKLQTDNQIINLSVDLNGNLKSNEEFLIYKDSQNELFKFELNKYLS
jgi:hypothetical protein